MVTLRFELVARNADQAKANQEVQGKAAKILALLNEKKIIENDVIAADLKSDRSTRATTTNPRVNVAN